MEDIGLTPEETGIKGSPTFVSKAFRPEHNRGECAICKDCSELAIKIKEFVDDQLVAGWRNDQGYEIKELRVEVSKDGAAWATLPLDLNNTSEAEYTYLNQNWQVKQYTDTKEYYIDPTGDPIEITLRARHVEDEENDYIIFNFLVDNKESTDIVTNSNIRVTATFVPVEEVAVTKEWLDDNDILNLRPQTVTLKLMGSDGSEYTGVVDSDSDWKTNIKILLRRTFFTTIKQHSFSFFNNRNLSIRSNNTYICNLKIFMR